MFRPKHTIFSVSEEILKILDSDITNEENSDFDMHILVVEDNRVNQRIMRILLTKLGHKVGFAENGRVAIEKLKTTKFDCIFMDCQMPVMDGYETTSYIRMGKDGIPSDIFIVAVTALVKNEDIERCKIAGMNGFLSKPVKISSIKEALDRCAAHLEGKEKNSNVFCL